MVIGRSTRRRESVISGDHPEMPVRRSEPLIPRKYASDRLAIDARLLFAILCLEATGLFILRLPATLGFDTFAFFDTGANLTVQYLLNHGYRPAVDFSYPYGLLPLLVGRLWFAALGLTPAACVALIPLADLLIAWAMVRFAVDLRLNLAGVLLLVLNAPLLMPSSFLNLTHGFEPIFILHALADQASGNRRRALALAAACVFVKPSMAFFLGLILLVFMIATHRLCNSSLSAILDNVYPAAAI